MDLDVQHGELLVVVGPSGSGKSTLLRCVAGLEDLDSGRIKVGDVDVTDATPGARDVAMVFQDYALYPHLDVATNISFPLLARKVDPSAVKEKVARAVRMLDIEDVLGRRPGELSGGERRRVSLARAVVREPAAFLMDEPLSNLDAGLRLRVLDEIRNLQRTTGTTTIYVTHDQTEAMMLGRRVAVLRAGRVVQVADPLELYDRPANTFVARFIGRTPMNLLPPKMLGLESGAQIGIRAEHLRVVGAGRGRFDATVAAVDHLGADVLLEAHAGDHQVLVLMDRAAAPVPGQEISLDVSEENIHVFDGAGEAVR
ncbi:MAG: ABC transporter ATP-binding protein [Actinomycetota bacterium]